METETVSDALADPIVRQLASRIRSIRQELHPPTTVSRKASESSYHDRRCRLGGMGPSERRPPERAVLM